jgi:hypothetical protein
MATASQSQPQLHELTVLTRVASIPIVASSLDQIHTTLSSNALTRSPYHAAQAITQSAYNYSQPLQIRLAPLMISADGYANKGLDVIEQKYPYPFKAKPEEVASYVRERRDSVMSSANKRFDENVKSPAVGVVEGIDKVSNTWSRTLEISEKFCRNLLLLSITSSTLSTKSVPNPAHLRRVPLPQDVSTSISAHTPYRNISRTTYTFIPRSILNSFSSKALWCKQLHLLTLYHMLTLT